MTKTFCDACGADIPFLPQDNKVSFFIYGPFESGNAQRDFCISCATRINKKLDAFIEELKTSEGRKDE